MLGVPVGGAQWLLVPEVRVAVEEVLGLGVAVELDQDPVRVDEVAEVLPADGVARRIAALARGALRHLGHGQELVAEGRQPGVRHALRVVRAGVDGKKGETLAFGIERRQPLVQREAVGARPGRPEGTLRDRLPAFRVETARRRALHLGVDERDAIGREGRQPLHRGPLAGRP